MFCFLGTSLSWSNTSGPKLVQIRLKVKYISTQVLCSIKEVLKTGSTWQLSARVSETCASPSPADFHRNLAYCLKKICTRFVSLSIKNTSPPLPHLLSCHTNYIPFEQDYVTLARLSSSYALWPVYGLWRPSYISWKADWTGRNRCTVHFPMEIQIIGHLHSYKQMTAVFDLISF